MHSSGHSLRSFNTFGIDASCTEFKLISSASDVAESVSRSQLQPYILGGGSNMLIVNDLDYLVLKNEIMGIEIIEENDQTATVRVGGGVIWHDFVLWAIGQNLGGIENLSLIPGCVGAAPIQNIGAYGVEQESCFVSLEAIELSTGNPLIYQHQNCEFGYRDSIFKRGLKGKIFITYVTYSLTKNHQLNLSYGAIADTLQQMNISEPTIRDVSRAVIKIRSSKLPDPSILGNSGSFFKNPIVSPEFYAGLLTRYHHIVHYKLDNGDYKIPAGWLIDQSGWKGYREGNVGCYEKQALVIVNYGGATGKEIWNFAQKIQSDVFMKYNILLEPEVNVLT